VVHEEGGEESSPKGDFGVPPVAELPAFLQEVLQTFQDREMESQGEDPLRGHAGPRPKCKTTSQDVLQI